MLKRMNYIVCAVILAEVNGSAFGEHTFYWTSLISFNLVCHAYVCDMVCSFYSLEILCVVIGRGGSRNLVTGVHTMCRRHADAEGLGVLPPPHKHFEIRFSEMRFQANPDDIKSLG
jgi:hypothetical protein